MKSLGLNPSEQAVIDIPNHIGRNGLIYFADFCQLVLDWFREDGNQEEAFRQAMFRVRPRVTFTYRMFTFTTFFLLQVKLDVSRYIMTT